MQCPICREKISANAVVCEHCGFMIGGKTGGAPEVTGTSDQAPREAVFAPQPTIAIKKTGIIGMILLTLFTLGVYIPIWFINRKEGINSLNSPAKLRPGLLVLTMVLYCVSLGLGLASGILTGVGEYMQRQDVLIAAKSLDALSSVTGLAGGILVIALSLTVRKILQQHCDAGRPGVKTSWIAAFFLQIYYLQYKINRLFHTPPRPQAEELH